MKEKLLFLGDLYYDYPQIVDDIDQISNWIHVNGYKVVLNLEGAIKNTARGTAITKRGPNLASHSTVIDVLKKLNVVGVTLANNHLMDFGEELLNNTVHLLDEESIGHAGAGRNLKEALAPFGVMIDGVNIGILSFGWDVEETVYATATYAGCAPRDTELILNSVKEATKVYEQVIVYMHWGFEYNRLPMPYDVNLAHQMIDAGASLIIGSHPHCIQPLEIYHGKKIYYSLGNFYFAGRRDRYTKRFRETIANQSDYGLMVGYDVREGDTVVHGICYSHGTKQSVVMEAIDSNILQDITGFETNCDEYVKEAGKRKLNVNPILTMDKKKNRRQLQFLFLRYKLKALAKKILRRN